MFGPPHFHISSLSYFSFDIVPRFLIFICFISIHFSNFVLFSIASSFNSFNLSDLVLTLLIFFFEDSELVFFSISHLPCRRFKLSATTTT